MSKPFNIHDWQAKQRLAENEDKSLQISQEEMEKHHQPKNLYFGDIKTAIAKSGGKTIYEVVYVEMKDPLVNSSGTAIASEIKLRDDITKPLLGPLASDFNVTADFTTYEVTTDGGTSFMVSGSKIRYANNLSADLGTFEKLFPNAVANMRSTLKNLGEKEYQHLPLWMRTSQDTKGVPLGYTMAVPLAYCKPGQSALVQKRIKDKNIDFKKINFVIDRYRTNLNSVNTGTITTDGSTTSYTLNELVHEEEIKVRNDKRELVFGEQVRADNNLSPSFLSADSLIRSADYEPDFSLTHDGSSKKTTINFTKAPASTSSVRVERKGDKYLAFRKKLKE